MTDKPNLSELMKKAQEMQKVMNEAHEALSRAEFIGISGGGMVEVTLTGRYDAKRVKFTDEAFEEGKEVLQDLTAAAINDAVRKVEKASQDKMMRLTKDLGIPTGEGAEEK